MHVPKIYNTQVNKEYVYATESAPVTHLVFHGMGHLHLSPWYHLTPRAFTTDLGPFGICFLMLLPTFIMLLFFLLSSSHFLLHFLYYCFTCYFFLFLATLLYSLLSFTNLLTYFINFYIHFFTSVYLLLTNIFVLLIFTLTYKF